MTDNRDMTATPPPDAPGDNASAANPSEQPGRSGYSGEQRSEARRERWEARRERGQEAFSRHGLRPQLVIGIFLMIAGILLTVDRLGLLAASGVLRFWPTVVMAIGASMLVSRSDARGRFWGTVWVLLGGWMLLRSLGIITVGLGDLLWPLLLVFIGMRLITRATNYHLPFGLGGASDTAHLFAVMSESRRLNNDNPFKAAQISAFMGGCHLDLRQAVIPAGAQAVIDVFSMMGGTEVWVPSGWTVVSEIVPIMGAVDDKRLPMMPSPGAPAEAPRRLLLRGVVIMSGVTIKN